MGIFSCNHCDKELCILLDEVADLSWSARDFCRSPSSLQLHNDLSDATVLFQPVLRLEGLLLLYNILSWPAVFTKLHSTGKFITLSANSMWHVKEGNALCQLRL